MRALFFGYIIIVLGFLLWFQVPKLITYLRGRKKRKIEDAGWAVVLANLTHHPEEWVRKDKWRLANKKREIEFWIANKDYGLGIAYGRTQAQPDAGGISPRWRKRFWKAIQPLLDDPENTLHFHKELVRRFQD